MLEFQVGQEVMVKIPEMTAKTSGKVYPAEEFVGTVVDPKVFCRISQVERVRIGIADGGTMLVSSAWITPYVKPVRTPLTWDNLVEWAKGQRCVDQPTVELVLVELLLRHDRASYDDHSAEDLLEIFLEMHRNGVRGYVDMGRAELKLECRERFLGGGNYSDLEELIDRLTFDNPE